MGFSVLGVNHNTASIELREQVAFLPEKLAEAGTAFSHCFEAADIVILSTCNRTEIYSLQHDLEKLLSWFSNYQKVDAEDLKQHIYFFQHENALHHLVRVSSGLDSMMLGETQIFGQVKQAVQQARQQNFIGGELGWFFDQAFHATKYIRSNTAVGELAVSTGLAVVRLTQQIFNHLSELNALLIGAGEMNTLVAKHLVEQGLGRLTIANRTLENAEKLKQQLSDKTIIETTDLDKVYHRLHEFDLICSCTASADYLVHFDQMKQAIKKRKYRPVVAVDLAVPRDIDPNVNDLEDVYLHSIDDLHEVIRHNTQQRQEAAGQAEQIVSTQVHKIMGEARGKSASTIISQYRQSAEAHRQQLMSDALEAIAEGKDIQKTLEVFSRSLTNKLLHEPTLMIKKLAEYHQDDLFLLLDKDKNTF